MSERITSLMLSCICLIYGMAVIGNVSKTFSTIVSQEVVDHNKYEDTLDNKYYSTYVWASAGSESSTARNTGAALCNLMYLSYYCDGYSTPEAPLSIVSKDASGNIKIMRVTFDSLYKGDRVANTIRIHNTFKGFYKKVFSYPYYDTEGKYSGVDVITGNTVTTKDTYVCYLTV